MRQATSNTEPRFYTRTTAVLAFSRMQFSVEEYEIRSQETQTPRIICYMSERVNPSEPELSILKAGMLSHFH